MWKEKAYEAISPVLAQHRQACQDGSMNRSQLRRELNKVYPFGQRKHYPCKVWCAMVNDAIDAVFKVPAPDADLWNDLSPEQCLCVQLMVESGFSKEEALKVVKDFAAQNGKTQQNNGVNQ
jgi:hypothetical protein